MDDFMVLNGLVKAHYAQADQERVEDPAPSAPTTRIVLFSEARAKEVLEEIKNQATTLLAVIRAAHPRYSTSLIAHNGQTRRHVSVESGVYLKGRSRAKKDVICREVALKRALEASEDEEEQLTPSKKPRYGAQGKGKTEAELAREATAAQVAAEEAARVAEEAAAASAAARGRKTGRSGRGGRGGKRGGVRGGSGPSGDPAAATEV